MSSFARDPYKKWRVPSPNRKPDGRTLARQVRAKSLLQSFQKDEASGRRLSPTTQGIIGAIIGAALFLIWEEFGVGKALMSRA